MFAESTPSALVAQAAILDILPDLPDLCPLVPAACALEAAKNVGVDTLNPFKAFWDAFFVTSPTEALRGPLELIWAVPRVNFDADWFREAYTNNLVWYGLGFSIMVLIASIGIALAPGRDNGIRDVINTFVDWLWTLTQIAFIPVFSGGVLWLSYQIGSGLLGSVGVDEPKDVISLFDAEYASVGWMSLLARLVGTFLMLEVIVLYLLQIMYTLAAPIIVPFRTLGDVGRDWYVRMVRGILLGFAPLVMSMAISIAIFVLNNVPNFGATAFFEYVGVIAALVLAAWAPLKVSKKSRPYVTAMSFRLAQTHARPFESVRFQQPALSDSYQRYVERKQQKRQEMKDVVKDATVIVGATIVSGGAGAGIAAGATKSQTAAKAARTFQRSQAFAGQAKAVINANKKGAGSS